MSGQFFKNVLPTVPLLLALLGCHGDSGADSAGAPAPGNGMTDAVPEGAPPSGEPLLPEPLRRIAAGPEDYRARLSDLRPGDWLQLAPGEYRRGLPLRDLAGTAAHPIVISGPEDGEPAVFLARSGANTISLRNTAHLAIRRLTLDGRQLNVAGVVAEADSAWNHDILLEHLRIRHHDGSQGNSGITTRSPAWNWVIRHNDIREVGTGLYLGRPDGTGPFIGGLIENNFIADTLGYNLQIKHQNAREPLPGLSTEPQATVIRYNVFSKARRASGGAQARPNLLVGHWPPEGPGADDRYLIYANLFHENPHERLFQGEGNVALYNNLFINTVGDALLVWRHNDRPKNVSILQNTLVARGFGIRIDAPDPAFRQVVAGNAVFADQPLLLDGAVEAEMNDFNTRAAADAWLLAVDADLAQLDLYPRAQSLRHGGEGVSGFDLPHLDRDYNGRVRQPTFWGAYASPDPLNPGRVEGIGPAVSGCGPCR